MDQGGSGIQVFAFLKRTVVVYYTQVPQVRIEGTELRKRYGKKEMKKCAISSEEIFVHIAQSKALSFFLLPSHAAEMHVLAQLIESFPSPHGSCSCVEEKLWFRLCANASRSSNEKNSKF